MHTVNWILVSVFVFFFCMSNAFSQSEIASKPGMWHVGRTYSDQLIYHGKVKKLYRIWNDGPGDIRIKCDSEKTEILENNTSIDIEGLRIEVQIRLKNTEAKGNYEKIDYDINKIMPFKIKPGNWKVNFNNEGTIYKSTKPGIYRIWNGGQGDVEIKYTIEEETKSIYLEKDSSSDVDSSYIVIAVKVKNYPASGNYQKVD